MHVPERDVWQELMALMADLLERAERLPTGPEARGRLGADQGLSTATGRASQGNGGSRRAPQGRPGRPMKKAAPVDEQKCEACNGTGHQLLNTPVVRRARGPGYCGRVPGVEIQWNSC
jgi:hypothetical protein